MKISHLTYLLILLITTINSTINLIVPLRRVICFRKALKEKEEEFRDQNSMIEDLKREKEELNVKIGIFFKENCFI